MTLATDLTAVNDGAVIQDFNARNAVTGLKAAITTVGARVATTIASTNATTIATTQCTFLVAQVDAIINALRTAGLMN